MENVACKGSFSISDKLFQKYLTISENIAKIYHFKSTKECSWLVGDIGFSFLLNKQLLLHLSKEFRNLKGVCMWSNVWLNCLYPTLEVKRRRHKIEANELHKNRSNKEILHKVAACVTGP